MLIMHQKQSSQGVCRDVARPLRLSYLDQQWRTQYVIGERIQYIKSNIKTSTKT
jgi:hypothetical protein